MYRPIKFMRQTEMQFRTWGGKRDGAGRKPRFPNARPHVPHRARGAHKSAHPVHVTLRARAGLPPFRERGIFVELREAIRRASRSPAVGDAFRVVQFSVQRDHVHLIVEARDRDVLSRGVRGLAIRLARAVNRALAVRGNVWSDRFHARELTSPRAVRNAIVYVLMNARKHGTRIASGIDAYSSAPWFDGFAARVDATPVDSQPVFAPRTWLAGVGWRRRGLVRFDERPRAPA
jgi:REP element-mobilizing transposase RayT